MPPAMFTEQLVQAREDILVYLFDFLLLCAIQRSGWRRGHALNTQIEYFGGDRRCERQAVLDANRISGNNMPVQCSWQRGSWDCRWLEEAAQLVRVEAHLCNVFRIVQLALLNVTPECMHKICTSFFVCDSQDLGQLRVSKSE